MKYVLVVLVVALVLWLLLRGRGRGGAPNPPAKPTAPKGKAGPVEMVACAHCGVHLPQGDALLDAAGRTFCGTEHRDASLR